MLVWGLELHVWADSIAFSFAVVAIILCSVQIHHHIYHNHLPETRVYVIRILLMVVVYCIESWFGLFTPQYHIYLDAIRDSYEALVIYSFYHLLISSLGKEQIIQECLNDITNMRHINHLFPFSYCFKPWSFQHNFLSNCTKGVVQYCVIQPICALVTFIMQLNHSYCEGSFEYNCGYPYISIIRSISQTWAIYCLVFFYLALKKQDHDSQGYIRFKRLRAVPKFLCIKGVVFFTFWQSLLLSALVYFNIIKNTKQWTNEDISIALQDFIICIEMFVFSIIHFYAFKVKDFEEYSYSAIVPHKILFDVANVADVVSEANEVLINKNEIKNNIKKSLTKLLPNKMIKKNDNIKQSDVDENDYTSNEYNELNSENENNINNCNNNNNNNSDSNYSPINDNIQNNNIQITNNNKTIKNKIINKKKRKKKSKKTKRKYTSDRRYQIGDTAIRLEQQLNDDQAL